MIVLARTVTGITGKPSLELVIIRSASSTIQIPGRTVEELTRYVLAWNNKEMHDEAS